MFIQRTYHGIYPSLGLFLMVWAQTSHALSSHLRMGKSDTLNSAVLTGSLWESFWTSPSMESGGVSGVSFNDTPPEILADLKAAKLSSAAAQSERDQARPALTQHQKRPWAPGASNGGNASDPTTGKGKGATRGGTKKRGKKGGRGGFLLVLNWPRHET